MKISIRIAAVAFVLALASGVWAAQKLWVSSSGVSLKAENKALSKSVAAVKQGTELKVLEEAGTWYRVAAPDGTEGWVYRGKVTEEKPKKEYKPTGGGLFTEVASSRIEAGASDTSRSIRGLSEETEAYANSAGSPKQARDALDKVLETRVAEKDLEQFLRDGRIGEYAP